MIRWLPAMLLLLGGYALSAEASSAVPAKRGFSVMRYLQPGNVLKTIRTVRYQEHRLDAEMWLHTLRLIDASHVLADALKAVLHSADGRETRISARNAVYDLDAEMIRSEGEAMLDDSQFTAVGTGFSLDVNTKRGFLIGPVRTTFSVRGAAATQL